MEDLIPPQIKDSCKLALPDGLNELMSDITREVLRYRPRDLYMFIADYLSALLVTRDNLSIAGYLCSDITQCTCDRELHVELRDIGVPEDDIIPVKDIIVNHLEKGFVDESSLIMKLLKETNIDGDLLPAVQSAIRKAFLRHQARTTTVYESSSGSEQDEMLCAAKHTLNLYKKTAPSEETYEIMAQKIQKAYRAYGVRRRCVSKDATSKSTVTKSPNKSITLVDPNTVPQMSNPYDIVFPKTTYSEETFSVESSFEDPEIAMSSSMSKKRVTTMSSTSLAGSFLSLPSFKPYSAHDYDILSDLDEYPEREHAYIDYTADNPHISVVLEDNLFYKRDKKICFNDAVLEEAKMGLGNSNEPEPKDSKQKESLMGADADLFYPGDVMKVGSNYDGDTEMDQSDTNLNENKDNDDEPLELVYFDHKEYNDD